MSVFKRAVLTPMLSAALLLTACNADIEKAVHSAPSSAADLYYGQIPPGLTPEPFPSDFYTSDDWQLTQPFATGKDEFYFTTRGSTPFGPVVIVFRKEGRVWKQYDFYTFSSGDKTRLYSKHNYIEWTDTGWSKIKSLGKDFENIPIMRLSASAQGTFILDEGAKEGVMRYSRLVDGVREAPKPLNESINAGIWNGHPFISPDGSYMIWDSEREDGYGDSDLYISFRQQDNSWGNAINMGDPINTAAVENAIRITPDGKYLSFGRATPVVQADGSTSWEGGRYWVSAQVIENLRIQHQP